MQDSRETHCAHSGCTHFRGLLEERGVALSGITLLVVGSGDGTEAAYFAGHEAAVTALDPSPQASDPQDPGIEFLRARLEDDAGPARLFDLIFCYHVLEHMENPRRALLLMRERLAPWGWLYLGTPNRSRVLGYLGSSDVTIADKVRWNLTDWRRRLAGTFRNELGAHAGFARRELLQMAEERFESVEDVTIDYIRRKYATVPSLVTDAITSCPAVFNHVTPAFYMLCQKRPRAAAPVADDRSADDEGL